MHSVSNKPFVTGCGTIWHTTAEKTTPYGPHVRPPECKLYLLNIKSETETSTATHAALKVELWLQMATRSFFGGYDVCFFIQKKDLAGMSYGLFWNVRRILCWNTSPGVGEMLTCVFLLLEAPTETRTNLDGVTWHFVWIIAYFYSCNAS